MAYSPMPCTGYPEQQANSLTAMPENSMSLQCRLSCLHLDFKCGCHVYFQVILKAYLLGKHTDNPLRKPVYVKTIISKIHVVKILYKKYVSLILAADIMCIFMWFYKTNLLDIHVQNVYLWQISQRLCE